MNEYRNPAAGVNEYRNPAAGENEFRNGGTASPSNMDSPLYRSNSNAPGSTRAPAYRAPQPTVPARPDRITKNDAGWKPVQAPALEFAGAAPSSPKSKGK